MRRIFPAFTFFAIATVAIAQTTHPDVRLKRTGSTYPFSCQPTEPIDGMTSICAIRTDLVEPIELGCVDHATLEVATLTITVERTPFADAEIRCYAIDSEGNVSDFSDNVGFADFTPNGRPFVP